MAKLIKHEDFKVNLKEKHVLKAAPLLFKTMCFSSKFVYVLYAKMGWQSTQQITIHPVHEKTANYHRNRQQICGHRRKTCEQFYQPLLANFLTPEFFNIFTKNHFPTMRFQSFDYTHKLLNFGYPTGGQFDILSGERFNSVLDAHCYRC